MIIIYYDLDNSNMEPYAKAYYLINEVKARFMLKQYHSQQTPILMGAFSDFP